jgi:hypothetical protein
MTHSLLATNRRNVAVIAVAAVAVAVSACSGAGTSTGASSISSRAAAKLITYSFTTVAPMARDENVVTGINNASPTEIVGYYYPTGSSGSSYGAYESFTSVGPNYSTFTPFNLPNAVGTAIQSITTPTSASPLPVEAGWVYGPKSLCANTYWGVVNNAGLWSLIKQYKSGAACSSNSTTKSKPTNFNYLYGINDNNLAVGYYVKSNGPETAWEVAPGEQQTPVPLPWTVTSSIAYGVNDNGDMAGTATISGVQKGWYYIAAGGGCFVQISYPGSGSVSTTARAINYGRFQLV